MKPFVLLILDGWGIRKEASGNAILNGNTPFIDTIHQTYPTVPLKAFGNAVGLPEGYMGNSEVGHLTIGSGRVVWQMFERINRTIADGSFFTNQKLLACMEHCKKQNKTLHIMGLFSDKGVHAHQDHCFALLKLASEYGVRVKVHAFTDGRDAQPGSAATYLATLQEQLNTFGGEIATISGRYYAMDRDKRWDRTEKAYRSIVFGEGQRCASVKEALAAFDKQHLTDEFFLPTVLGDYQGLEEDDAVLFFNYRTDRARQLSHALVDPTFDSFPRNHAPIHLYAFSEYYKGLHADILFEEPVLTNVLGKVLSDAKLSQVRMGETEKYAHVTYFFNGQVETPFPKEERIIVPSPKVATYELTPEMGTPEITKRFLEEVGKHDVFIINFSNGDMIGHTGNYEAALKAVEIIDKYTKQIVEAVQAQGGQVLIIADHGNCEEMLDAKGKPLTAHTLNDVPCTLIGSDRKLHPGGLADVAPTIIELLGLTKPVEMNGSSLLL